MEGEKKSDFHRQRQGHLEKTFREAPIINGMNENRRLFPRLKTDVSIFLSYFGVSGSVVTAAKVIEFAKDNLSCQLQMENPIPIGTEVAIEFDPTLNIPVLMGEICSCAIGSELARVGVKIRRNGDVLFANFLGIKGRADRRKGERRTIDDTNAGKREFDRRGVWRGLLSKRYFSHHAWELRNLKSYFYMKTLRSASDAHVMVDGQEMVMMSSNNYLGLSVHPKIKEAGCLAMAKYGAGSTASPILGGTFDIHLELEEALAQFKHVEAVCLFASGYVTNFATLTTILGKGDAVFSDEKNHASLLDGIRYSDGDFRAYRHNRIYDLVSKLQASKAEHKLVVSDTIFSMDGDEAQLIELVRACKLHNAALMIDEAHAEGVYGQTGSGLLEHCGLLGKAEVVMGTLSKTISSTGGFIGGSKELISILKHSARGLIFSTSISPISCAVALAALKIIQEEPELREKLWLNAQNLRQGLQNLGFNTGLSTSPIIPVIFETESQTNAMVKYLLQAGVYASPVIYPAVRKDLTRVRLTVTASHSKEDIDLVLKTFMHAKKLSKV